MNELVRKIEKLVKSKIASEEVVSLDTFRGLNPGIKKKEILIIEDDEQMRIALVRLMEAEGYIAIAVANAMELTQVLNRRNIDLILLDVGLPWVDGFELAQLLKSHKEFKKIPFVFISGKNSAEMMKKAFKIGANDFLTKPFDVEKMKKTIRLLLKM